MHKMKAGWAISLVTMLYPVGAAGQDLSLSVQPASNAVILGVPLTLRLEVRNVSTDDLIVKDSLEPKAGNVAIEISKRDDTGVFGPFLRYQGPGWGIADIYMKAVHIPPGGKLAQSYVVYWNHPIAGDAAHIPDNFAFSKAGHYKIRLRLFRSNSPDLLSPAMEMDVTSAAGDDGAVWVKLLAEPDLAALIQRPDNLTEESAVVMRQMLATYPKAAIAPFLESALTRPRISKR